MIRATVLALALLPLSAAVDAAPGGPLGTLPIGTWRCELPGDATGPAGVASPQDDFAITHASSYRTAAGIGIYLLTGTHVTFTSGPLAGVRMHRLSDNFLRRIEADGTDGPLRCVRRNGQVGEVARPDQTVPR